MAPETLRKLVAQGVIPHTRYGRKIVLRREDLAAWYDSQEARTSQLLAASSVAGHEESD
jgi:excisionase family DNA binding protein